MLFLQKYRVLLIFLVFLAGISAAVYWYYKDSQSTIETLSANNARLEVALDNSQASLQRLQAEQKRLNTLIANLQVNLDDSEVVITDLRKLLNDHDLTRLAKAKPGLIEKRMQEATNEVFSNIVNDTTNYGVQLSTDK